MKLSIDFTTLDDEASGLIAEALESLVGLQVDLLIPNNTGYPAANVYVERIDPDGELVVCETDGRGTLLPGTWAIPQHLIRHIHVPLGGAA